MLLLLRHLHVLLVKQQRSVSWKKKGSKSIVLISEKEIGCVLCYAVMCASAYRNK